MFKGEDITLSEQGTVATCSTQAFRWRDPEDVEIGDVEGYAEFDEDRDTAGHSVRSREPLLPKSGVHLIEYVYEKSELSYVGELDNYGLYSTPPKVEFGPLPRGSSLNSCHCVGVVRADVPIEDYDVQYKLRESNAWWGVEDGGEVYEGACGKTREETDAHADSLNANGRLFGSSDKICFAIDMDKGTMQFYRNGKALKGTKITGVPIDKPLYLFATPLDPGATVRIALPDAVEYAQQSAEDAKAVDYTALVTALYQKHNPEELEDPNFVTKTLKRYEGKEGVLIQALKTKYEGG
jgi:hypothetical protein